MPPSKPNQSIPDTGGFSYMLVNTGVYPWSRIAAEPSQSAARGSGELHASRGHG
jgi:hypothetical protein